MLRAADIGREAALAGWVQSRRDHGGIIFIDLRDRTGITQIAFSADTDKEAHRLAESVRTEYVLAVRGKVYARPEGTVNPNLPTGEIEVYIDELEVLNTAKTPPFPLEDDTDASEALRLRYRYLDLRRAPMQRVLFTRHKIAKTVRNFLDAEDFVEVYPLLPGHIDLLLNNGVVVGVVVVGVVVGVVAGLLSPQPARASRSRLAPAGRSHLLASFAVTSHLRNEGCCETLQGASGIVRP